MDTSPPTWADLKRLMITPQPDLTVEGVVSTDEREVHFGSVRWEHQAPPLTLIALADDDGPATLHVRMKGERHRFERPDGRVFFIHGTDRSWQFHDDRPGRPDEGGPEVSFVGTVGDLVTRPDRDRFQGTDFTTPTGPVGPTEYLGRPAWEVELAPPSHKPYPLAYVVDAETGLLLQERNERAGLLAGWVEFRVGAKIPDEVFTWDGPVITEEERAAADWAEHEADLRRRNDWFEQNVAPQPITMQLNFTGSINVHDWQDDGSFDGSFGEPVILFSRRPLARADFGRGDGATYEWTSGQWRWRVTVYDGTFAPAALRSLQEQLRAIPD